jgi:hypothetical protein
MSISVPRVFISSTGEFAAERALLKQELESLPDCDLDTYIYEAEASSGDAPAARLRRALDDSEILVLILGDRFGTEYPGQTTSVVEWEYEYAKAKKKEIKAYVKDPFGPDVDPRQTAFVARAMSFRNGSWIRKFNAAPQLVSTAVADVKRWIVEAGAAWLMGKHERTAWKDKAVLGGCVAVAIATIIGMAAGTLMNVPFERLAILFACGASLFAGLFVLLKSDVL